MRTAFFRRPAVSTKLTYAAVLLVVLAGLTLGSVNLFEGGASRNSRATEKSAPAVVAAVGRVKPSTVTVALLNGTSTVGLALNTGQTLQRADFVIGTTTNAATADVKRSRVLRVAGQDAAAQAVARRLAIKDVSDADSVSKTIAGSADVIVLVGADRQ